MRARTSRPKDEGQRTKDKVLGRRIDRHPILTFEDRGPVSFFFEGRPMTGRQGETIAAALAANGVRLFRHAEKTGRPRGFFCAVGKCASCLMVVDGHPNTMICMEPLREGVKVDRQSGRGKLP
jgi:predicted molibdopterin-dependent oxidoreductase YjgC